MSILNVHVSAHRVLVSVDTRVIDQGGRFSHASKLAVVPHAGLVLAARGDVILFGQIVAALNNDSPVGFDDAEGMVDAELHTEYHTRLILLEAHNVNRFDGIELCLAGWSESRQCMQAIRWELKDGQKVATVVPVEPWSLSPDAGTGEAPEPDSLDQMATYAIGQVKRFHAEHPGAAIGGRLIGATLTREAVMVRTVADLGEVPA